MLPRVPRRLGAPLSLKNIYTKMRCFKSKILKFSLQMDPARMFSQGPAVTFYTSLVTGSNFWHLKATAFTWFLASYNKLPFFSWSHISNSYTTLYRNERIRPTIASLRKKRFLNGQKHVTTKYRAKLQSTNTNSNQW